MSGYVYRPAAAFTDFDVAADALSRRTNLPIVRAWVDHTNPSNIAGVVDGLRDYGVPCDDVTIDPIAWSEYVEQAGYSSRYPNYYPSNVKEKSFEHYLALTFLALQPGAVFVDLASEGSPLPEIAGRLAGCRGFAQDIMYEPGIRGTRIGGDAAEMPVPDGFAQGVCLTCSLEHFEGDADIRLFKELARVLSAGGRVVVVPLYIVPSPAVQTDPLVSATVDVPFDREATIFCAAGWGNRHGRFYSPETLVKRLIEPSHDAFRFHVHLIKNPDQVDVSIYARFVLVATKI